MELSGKVFKMMPLETGEGKNGVWKKQQVVIETENAKYPKKVAVTLWGDLVGNESISEGKGVSVEFDVESREHNGKWYTDVKVWRINTSHKKTESVPQSEFNKVADANGLVQEPLPTDDDDSDLPF